MQVENSFLRKINICTEGKNSKMLECTLPCNKLVITCLFHDFALGVASCSFTQKLVISYTYVMFQMISVGYYSLFNIICYLAPVSS